MTLYELTKRIEGTNNDVTVLATVTAGTLGQAERKLFRQYKVDPQNARKTGHSVRVAQRTQNAGH